MAHAAVNWVVDVLSAREDLKPAEKWLLVIMADHASRDAWSFFHGNATLAKDAGMSKRSVVTMLQKFEEEGLIRRVPRFRADGTRSTDLISLLGGENPALGNLPGADYGSDQVQTATRKRSKVAPLNQGSEPGKIIEEATVVSLPSDERRAFDRWNELAERHGWPKATAYTDVRRGHIKARIKDAGGLEAWLGFVGDIENSPFLMGRRPGRHGAFTISLDFILQPASWTKLMDGFYHRDRTATQPPGGGVSRHQERRSAFVAGALAAADRAKGERGWPGGS